MKLTKSGLVITAAELQRAQKLVLRHHLWVISVLATIGMVLAFFGLRAGFEELGYGSREAHIVMIAGLIMGLLTLGTIGYTRHLLRSARRDR